MASQQVGDTQQRSHGEVRRALQAIRHIVSEEMGVDVEIGDLRQMLRRRWKQLSELAHIVHEGR